MARASPRFPTRDALRPRQCHAAGRPRRRLRRAARRGRARRRRHHHRATASSSASTRPAAAPTLPRLDLDRGMVWPCFVDMHTHLDKGHIWPRRRNPDGTFAGALDAVARRPRGATGGRTTSRAAWISRCAPPTPTARRCSAPISIRGRRSTAISWPVFAEMRERWAGRIELQAVSLFAIDHFARRRLSPARSSTLVADHGGVLGAVTFMMPGPRRALER